jgi:hypothetical protein
MAFYAVGDGVGDHSSAVYRFSYNSADPSVHRSRYRQLILVALETAVQLAASTRDLPARDDDEVDAELGALHGKVRAFADRLAAIIDDPHGGGDGERELGELRAALAAMMPRPG